MRTPASDRLANAQRQQRILKWVTPTLTLMMFVLAALQGEQQRPLKGFALTTWKNLPVRRIDRMPNPGRTGRTSGQGSRRNAASR